MNSKPFTLKAHLMEITNAYHVVKSEGVYREISKLLEKVARLGRSSATLYFRRCEKSKCLKNYDYEMSGTWNFDQTYWQFVVRKMDDNHINHTITSLGDNNNDGYLVTFSWAENTKSSNLITTNLALEYL